jgi:hypothetical protein
VFLDETSRNDEKYKIVDGFKVPNSSNTGLIMKKCDSWHVLNEMFIEFCKIQYITTGAN